MQNQMVVSKVAQKIYKAQQIYKPLQFLILGWNGINISGTCSRRTCTLLARHKQERSYKLGTQVFLILY